MKQTMTIYDFRDAFLNSSRSTQFSYEALGLIFELLEEIEGSGGDELEFDLVGICCDFCECPLSDAVQDFELDIDLRTATGDDVADALMDAGSPWAAPTGAGVVYFQF